MLLLFQATAGAQSFALDELTVNDGLSQGFVTAFCQDKQGFLWIGTTNGLNRYDGYEVRTFPRIPDVEWALGDPYINCLLEDEGGILWVGTPSGLYLFEPVSERFFPVQFADAGLAQIGVSNVVFGKNRSCFILSQSNGLFRVQVPEELATTLKKSPHEPLRFNSSRIPMQGPGAPLTRILGAISDTCLLLQAKTRQLYYFTPENGVVKGLDIRQARQMSGQEADVLWSGRTGFFFKSDPKISAPENAPVLSDSCIFRVDQHLSLLLPFSKPYLFKRANSPATSARIDLGCPFSIVVYADRSGNIWIGTTGCGARILKTDRTPFGYLLPGYSAFNFRQIDSNRVWMGKTHPNELLHLKTQKIEQAPWLRKLPPDFKPYNLIADPNGNCWFVGQIDSASQLVFWKKKTGTYQILPERLKNFSYVAEQLLLDRDNNIWVGGHDGQCLRFRPGSLQPERFSYRNFLPSGTREARSNAIIQSPEGDLFIGTSHGLVQISDPNGTPSFRLFQHDPANPASLGYNAILSLFIAPSSPDILWIGTKGGGLISLDLQSYRFSQFTEADGLLNNVIYGIAEDTFHKLWLSSNRGLSRYDPGTGACNNFQKSDGVQSGEFNTGACLQLPSGQLLFGGVNGLTLLEPGMLKQSPNALPVVISKIRILGIPDTQARRRDSTIQAPGSWQDLRLHHTQNNLSFEFAGLDFSNPATNRYRYRLLGLDEHWIDNGTAHSAIYTGLEPGNYTFEVQAATALGEWSNETAQAHFRILPPWYRSWPAYLVYALLFLSLNLLYIRLRERSLLLEKNVEMAQQESIRLRELDAFKNRLLANITHEFRTPLALILGLAERLYHGKGADSGTASKSILQQGHNLLDLLNQIADLSSLSEQKIRVKLQRGNISNYIRYYAESLRSLATQKNIAFSVQSEVPDLIMDFDPERLRQIIVNLLANAFRHTAPNGKVNLNLSASDSTILAIRVSDTGEGIAKDQLPHIFERFYQATDAQKAGTAGLGLALTKDLVSLLGGTVAVDSEPGFGSLFTVTLPITRTAPLLEETGTSAVAFSDPFDQAGTVTAAPKDAPLILLIEDNSVIANYIVSCLLPEFRVLVANDGDSGIATATETVPDLVITDLTMPEKNGFAVVQELKAQEISSHIPIIILSANTAADDRIKGRRAGADAYLGKPFNEEELLLVIRNLLDLRQLWQRRYAQMAASGIQIEPLPETLSGTVKKEDAFMAKIYTVFEAHYADDSFDLDKLCQILGFSRSTLQRKLATLTNQSAMHLLRSFRLQKAYELLLTHPDINVSTVCFQVGFSNTAHFSRLFSKTFNMAPSEVRTGGK